MTSSLQTHQLFDHMAKKPIDGVTFPIHLNVMMRLREITNDPKSTTKSLTEVIKSEPMVSARIIQSANSAATHSQTRILDVDTAVARLGFSSIRRTTLAVAMVQLSQSKEMLCFSSLSRRIWLHSLYTASASHVISDTYTDISPEEMLFSGLMLNIGAFYFLWQISRLPGSEMFIDDIKTAIDRHYLDITLDVLKYMAMPKELIDSLKIKVHLNKDLFELPTTVQEVVYAANILASAKFPWIENASAVNLLSPLYTDLIPLIEERFSMLREEYS